MDDDDYFDELEDEDIAWMAREAEDIGRPRLPGQYYRQSSILLGLIPLEEIEEDELAWHFGYVAERGHRPIS